MSEPIRLQTPMGEITIPYDEDKILNFYRKMVKANEGDPDLFEEAYMEFFDLTSADDANSDWVFWEASRTPIHIYDFMGWIYSDFDVKKILGFSMVKPSPQAFSITIPLIHTERKTSQLGLPFSLRKSDNVKFVVDIVPVDGLHCEVQIIHEHSVSVKKFHEDFSKYSEKNGILKNNSVNANLEFINVEDVGWDDVVLTNEQRDAFRKEHCQFH